MEGSERASQRLARRVPREGVSGRRRIVRYARGAEIPDNGAGEGKNLAFRAKNPENGAGKQKSRGANLRLLEVSAEIGFLEPYVGQEPELIETGNREVLIFVVTVLELEVKVFVEAEIGADRIHVVGRC